MTHFVHIFAEKITNYFKNIHSACMYLFVCTYSYVLTSTVRVVILNIPKYKKSIHLQIEYIEKKLFSPYTRHVAG